MRSFRPCAFCALASLRATRALFHTWRHRLGSVVSICGCISLHAEFHLWFPEQRCIEIVFGIDVVDAFALLLSLTLSRQRSFCRGCHLVPGAAMAISELEVFSCCIPERLCLRVCFCLCLTAEWKLDVDVVIIHCRWVVSKLDPEVQKK